MNKLSLSLLIANLAYSSLVFAQSAQCTGVPSPIVQEVVINPFVGPQQIVTGMNFEYVNGGQCYQPSSPMPAGVVVVEPGTNNVICKFPNGAQLPCSQ
jgi:hypothetical protein